VQIKPFKKLFFENIGRVSKTGFKSGRYDLKIFNPKRIVTLPIL
jgi:hypothetical protein